MNIKDICTKKTYKDRDGKEKTVWLNVGSLREIDGKEYIELNMLPSTPFYVFAKKEKEPQVKVEQGEVPVEQVPDFNKMVDDVAKGTSYTDDDGIVKEIPF